MIGKYYRTTFRFLANWYWLFNASPANARYPVSYLQGLHAFVLIRGIEWLAFGTFKIPLTGALIGVLKGSWVFDHIAFGVLFLIVNLRTYNREYISKVEGSFVESKLTVFPKMLLSFVPGLCLGTLGLYALFGS